MKEIVLKEISSKKFIYFLDLLAFLKQEDDKQNTNWFIINTFIIVRFFLLAGWCCIAFKNIF